MGGGRVKSSPVLRGLQPQVAVVLRVEKGQEQVGLGQGRGGGRLPLCPGAGAARLGLQGRAEADPHRVGGPVGADGGGGRRRGEAARSDQNQFVPSALPAHRLGGVEATAEETIY